MVEYQKTDKLSEAVVTVNTNITLLYSGIAISILSALTFIILNKPIFVVFSIIFCAFCVTFSREKSRYKNILVHGLKGEKILKKTLKKILPDNYTAFYNVSFNGKGDIDCIVVGPSGVYIIEAKNHTGEISFSEKGWRQLKTSQRGNSFYNETFKNPLNQLDGHIFKVKKFFKDNGVNVWIKGVVVFTNPNVSLSLQRKPNALQVITIDNIKSIFNGNNAVTDQRQKREIEKIKRLLKKL